MLHAFTHIYTPLIMIKTLTILALSACSLTAAAQTHKTYSGEYGNSAYNGKATYQYIENVDGTRSFDGPFKYTDDYVTISGNFKDNKQVGVWTRKGKGYETHIPFVDGVVDGTITLSELHYYSKEKPTMYSFSTQNGHFAGPVDAYFKFLKAYPSPIVQGKFDKNGYKTGIWIEEEGRYRTIYKFQNGKLIETNRIDNSTGDREKIDKGDPFEFSILIDIVNEVIMRDSRRDFPSPEPYEEEDSKPDIPSPEPNIEEKTEDDRVFSTVEQMPSFPGGDVELLNHLRANIVYPPTAAENGVQGRVVVKFVVTKDGSIGDVEVVRGQDPELDKEAIRVVKTFPKFTPGVINGQPVNVWYTLPVQFRLTNK